MSKPSEIVAGRSCVKCTLCCKLMEVRDLGKDDGVWCKHVLQGRGCGIYQTRPESCRTFLCGWISTEALDEAWYPGRSKLILVSKEAGITALVDPSRADVWREEPYYSQLKAWARAYTPKGMIVLVKIGLRAIVLLPDEDVDLGTVNRSDDVFVDIIPGPGGNRYRVVHERPTGPAADKVEA